MCLLIAVGVTNCQHVPMRSLRAYTTVMNASADRLVNVLGAKAKAGQPVEIWRLFGCLTMEVICSTALG